MILGRWFFCGGRSYGVGVYFNGYRYPAIMAGIRDGRVWIGTGAEVSIGPFAIRWIHATYSRRFDLE